MNTLRFCKLTNNASTPTKGSSSAAGYDLYSAGNYVIPAGGKELVNTDLQLKLPLGTYGRIAPRSGLAWRHFIHIGAGVIDQDYRGNVGIVIFNFNDKEFQISVGDRIAQLICEKIRFPELEECEELDFSEQEDLPLLTVRLSRIDRIKKMLLSDVEWKAHLQQKARKLGLNSGLED